MNKDIERLRELVDDTFEPIERFIKEEERRQGTIFWAVVAALGAVMFVSLYHF
jgi:hypothetical protein